MAANKIDLKKTSSKQKIMMAIIAVIAIVIISQVMGLFGGSGDTQPLPSVPQKSTGPMNNPTPGVAANTASSNEVSLTPQQAHPTFQTSSEILKIQQDNEKKYLENINKLQMLKLEKEIAETNQAISNSKLAVITAEKGMADVLLKPAGSQVSAEAYAESLANPSLSGQNVQPAGAAPNVGTTSSGESNKPQNENYVVLSVMQHADKWRAVIGSGGKIFDVAVGGSLPNGSKVTKIDSNGVVLSKNETELRININSSI